jgi:integrase
MSQRPSGVWRARYRDPAGREHARHFPTKREARDWLAAETVALARGSWVDPRAGKVTFGAYAEAWRAAQKQWRPGTAAVAVKALRRVPAGLAAMPVGAIKHSDVQAWANELAGRLAPATTARTFRLVRQVLEAAVEDQLIAANPSRRVRIPPVPAGGPIRFFDHDEVQAATDAMPEHLRALVTVSADTGLRQGEAFAVTVDRVDFLRRRLVVDRQLVDGRFAPLKTAASARVIPLHDDTLEALAAHLGAFPPLEAGLVFTTLSGRPLRAPSLSKAWTPARAAADVTWARWHDLRHYCASVLIDQGCSVKEVQAVLGHASARETLDTYAHRFAAADERIRAAMGAGRAARAEALAEKTRTPRGLGPRKARSDGT